MRERGTVAAVSPERAPYPAPADIRAEVAAYDRRARVAHWNGPRYRMTYRELGAGPPLIVVPGIASTYRGYAIALNRLAPRFRTLIYDYPGEQADDRAALERITHADLVADLIGLVEHLELGPTFLFGLSFGSTLALAALLRDPARFPKAVLQGAFAHRGFSPAEQAALRLGRLVPGTLGRLPLHDTVLAIHNKRHFLGAPPDRWSYYLEQNAVTPIAAMARRLDLLRTVDLRPRLPEITSEILLIQGSVDPVVGRPHYDELLGALPRGRGIVMPDVGHQPHFTHAEEMADLIADWLAADAPPTPSPPIHQAASREKSA